MIWRRYSTFSHSEKTKNAGAENDLSRSSYFWNAVAAAQHAIRSTLRRAQRDGYSLAKNFPELF